MSSLPASPHPLRNRVSTLGHKARRLFLTHLRMPRSGVTEPARAQTPETASGSGTAPATADEQTAAGPVQRPPAAPKKAQPKNQQPAAPAGVVVPEVPAAAPAPAVPARIPYSEWKGPRPRAVRAAFALILLAGFISLISGVQASREPVTEMPPLVVQLGELGFDTREYAAVLQLVTLAAALVIFGLYLLFASMIREGRNWARIGGSILAAAALLWAVLSEEVPQTVPLLVAACGLVLLYRRDCARYFRPRRSQYLGES